MGKFRKKPVVIEAITFDELVEHGRTVAPEDAKEHGGFAWSFNFKGHPITHENDECYLIPTLEGTHHMTPKDMLITGVNGEIYPCKLDIFEKTYELGDHSEVPGLTDSSAILCSINKSIMEMNSEQIGQISDGYHTFKELYHHRIRLWIIVAKMCSQNMWGSSLPSVLNPVWITKTHSDGSSWDGWFLLGLGKEKGKQITYHLPMDYWDECADFALVLEKAPEFDGHTSADVLERLKELIS